MGSVCTESNCSAVGVVRGGMQPQPERVAEEGGIGDPAERQTAAERGEVIRLGSVLFEGLGP